MTARAAPPAPAPPAPESARGRGLQAALHNAEARLFSCAVPHGGGLELSLAKAELAGAVFGPADVGVVLLVDLEKEIVYRVNESRALLDKRMRAASREARACGTFALLLRGASAAAAVAWGHAPSVPAKPGELSLAMAARRVWPDAAGVLAALASAPSDRLLPSLRTLYQRYYAWAEIKGAAEFAAGQADARSPESCHRRAKSQMVTGELVRQLGAADAPALPGCLFRRMAARAAITAVTPDAPPPKPSWCDLEGLVQRAGWARVTRQTCGYPWPHAVHPPGSPLLQQINANALVEAYVAETGGVDNAHVIWTVGQHVAGHTPALEPHLEAAINAALAGGQPLRLFDPDRLPPAPAPREAQAHWGQVERLSTTGIFKLLAPEEVTDADKCKIVGFMSSVFKGTLPVGPEVQVIIDTGDTARISESARARAIGMLHALQKRVEPFPAGEAPRGELEALLAEELAEFTKVRPVCNYSALSRGNARLGLDPHGVPQSGFTFPQLYTMLHGASLSSWVSKVDLTDFFYQIRLSAAGSALTCVATRRPDGTLQYLSLDGLSMGAPDSPIVAELVSAVICAIVNARGAATETCAGYAAQIDDLVLVASEEHTAYAEGLLLALLAEISATEASKKRLRAPLGDILGKRFNFPAGTVSVPPERLYKYYYRLHLVRACLASDDARIRAQVTLDMLSRLAGVLQWLSECSTAGGSHLSVIYKVVAGGVSVAAGRQGLLRELDWWCKASLEGRAESTALLDGHAGLCVRTMGVDASATAIAAVLGKRVAWRRLKPAERTLSSAHRELLAYELGLCVFGEELGGARLAILSDSSAAVGAYNKGRTGGETGQDCLQACYALLDARRIYSFASYVPREFNVLPDAASKKETRETLAAWAADCGLTVA
jgi:hypothetical protein